MPSWGVSQHQFFFGLGHCLAENFKFFSGNTLIAHFQFDIVLCLGNFTSQTFNSQLIIYRVNASPGFRLFVKKPPGTILLAHGDDFTRRHPG